MKNYIIPIFIPHYGCRHDCVFCNQHKITGVLADVTPDKVGDTIACHLQRINRQRHVEVAFYGGSFTALPLTLQREFLMAVQFFLQKGEVDAVRVSTRPDCIDAVNLRQLCAYGVRVVELGVQSFDEAVLLASQRGHTAAAVEMAVRCLRQTDLQIGIQLMVGLPGDTWRSMMTSLERTIFLRPDFVRIYPVLVLKDTKLADLYQLGKYCPLSLDEAVCRSMVMKTSLENHGIRVVRTGLQATAELSDPHIVLAGPYHPAFGEMVDSCAFRSMIDGLLAQIDVKGQVIVIFHQAQDTSKIRGNKNVNTRFWQARYQPANVVFQTADDLQAGQVRVECDGRQYFLTKRAIASIPSNGLL